MGLGYVGLPTAVIIASRGVRVVGVDINPEVVESINEGRIHAVEPRLNSSVRSAVRLGRLRATTKIEKADAFLIAVPTPLGRNRMPDLSYVKSAVMEIASVLDPGNLVVLESTSPVGTTEKVLRWLRKARPDLVFPGAKPESGQRVFIAYCPERVLPGQALRELVENDRVIGGLTPECSARACALYQGFVKGRCFATHARIAEMVKLSENAFRDINIAFANELSVLCDQMNINVWEVIELANRHPRVEILQPGTGVGGHCIAVDPWFLISSSPDSTVLMRTARQTNDRKPSMVLQKIGETLAGLNKPVVACFGLAFKPDIDDVRGSAAIQVVRGLARDGRIHQLIVVEPNLEFLPDEIAGKKNIVFVGLEEAMDKADILVFLVAHKEFKKIKPGAISGKVVLDFVDALRNHRLSGGIK